MASAASSGPVLKFPLTRGMVSIFLSGQILRKPFHRDGAVALAEIRFEFGSYRRPPAPARWRRIGETAEGWCVRRGLFSCFSTHPNLALLCGVPRMIWDNATEIAARIAARIGGLTILASAILVALEVFSRNLGLGIKFHAFELTNFGFAAAVAFGFSYALTLRAHIRIDVLYQRFPVSMRAFFDCLSLLTLFLLASGMTYYAWGVVAQSAKLGARPNSTLDIPLAIPQAVWATGLTWFMLIALVLFLRSIIVLFAKGPTAAHKAFGVSTEADQGRSE